MSYRAVYPNVLEPFRVEWVRGHLDYQRAADALLAARCAADELLLTCDHPPDNDEARRAEQVVERAGRRLAEIEAMLAEQFDRFCGMSK